MLAIACLTVRLLLVQALHEETRQSLLRRDAGSSAGGQDARAALYVGAGCIGDPIEVHEDKVSLCNARHKPLKDGAITPQNGTRVKEPYFSVRVFTRSEQEDLALFSDCEAESYWSTVMANDGCVNVWAWPDTNALRFVPRTWAQRPSSPIAASLLATDTAAMPLFHIVSSQESSRYQGYQALAGWYSFEATKQSQKGGVFTRLLTAEYPDDLSATVPTFCAPRHPYSRRYGPLNKPDVVEKWFQASPPQAQVVVIVDPDSWLVGDLSPFAKRVSKGHAIASDYGSVAGHQPGLWKRICQANCDSEPQGLAVPYMLHRDDVLDFARKAKHYTLKMHEMMVNKEDVEGLNWMIEMAGFNFAAADMGLKFTLENLQRVDIQNPGDKSVPFLHMGRAWFPAGKAGHWDQTPYDKGAKDFAYRGTQVWCKANETADQIVPWPVPEGTDWVSRLTLEYIHKGIEKYGLPWNTTYRFADYNQPMM